MWPPWGGAWPDEGPQPWLLSQDRAVASSEAASLDLFVVPLLGPSRLGEPVATPPVHSSVNPWGGAITAARGRCRIGCCHAGLSTQHLSGVSCRLGATLRPHGLRLVPWHQNSGRTGLPCLSACVLEFVSREMLAFSREQVPSHGPGPSAPGTGFSSSSAGLRHH